MSDCRFQFDFPGSGAELVDKIRAKLISAGGVFDGSAETGVFELPTPVGAFKGDYSIQGNTIWLDVQKPVFISCSMIESKLGELVQKHR